MSQFLTLSQIRSIEQLATSQGQNLIERAGLATAKWVQDNISLKTRVLVIAGRGNNGSDAIAAAISLLALGYKVDLLRLFKDNTETNHNWYQQFNSVKRPLSRLPSDLNKYGLIIDGIYGIGLTHELDVETARIIQKINDSHNSQILSLDAPRGLNPFSGAVQGVAIKADVTLSYICDKPGLHTGDGLDYSGDVQIVDLVNQDEFALATNTVNVEFNSLASINYDGLLRTKFNTNKGSYGTVAVIGGNKGMHGALFLAGRAALLSGAGKVVLGALDDDFRLDFSMPELMSQAPKDIIKNIQAYDAIAIGPGLGQDGKAEKILAKLLDTIEDGKLLVDADALNLIAASHELRLKFREVRYKIITPHPGEAARILGMTVSDIQAIRFTAVDDLTNKLNSVTLLKGAGSLIQASNQVFINTTGNPGLANAGQGDTLTGIICGFLAQGLEMLDATRLGVYVHGLSADRLVLQNGGYNGILASNIATEASKLINEIVYGSLFATS